MLIALGNQFILHFFFGVSLVTLFTIPIYRAHKRRYIFHFGGESPMTIGSKSLWATWYTAALLLEIVTSLLTHSVYIEFALSIYQAVAFTAGAFIVDRFTMMWEPSNMYSLSHKATPNKATTGPTTVASEPAEAIPAVIANEAPTADETSPSWFSRTIKDAAKRVVSTPGVITENVRDSIREHSQQQEEDRIAKESAREEAANRERAGRRDRFHDMINRF